MGGIWDILAVLPSGDGVLVCFHRKRLFAFFSVPSYGARGASGPAVVQGMSVGVIVVNVRAICWVLGGGSSEGLCVWQWVVYMWNLMLHSFINGHLTGGIVLGSGWSLECVCVCCWDGSGLFVWEGWVVCVALAIMRGA